MRPLSQLPKSIRGTLRGVFMDIDDTLSTDGRITANAYAALERLHEARLVVVPITGRPAGWCDHIARMWPVDAVVGENGAFYFRYDRHERRMHKRFLMDADERRRARARLEKLAVAILGQVPGSAVSSDQLYREADLAIDYCEDVEPLPEESVQRIVALFREAGATAKVSSIHVNGWFGSYDKLGMTRIMMQECFDTDLDAERGRYVFVGDSPNDEPMFAFFPHSVAVANAGEFRFEAEPAYISTHRSGRGFVEIVDALLAGDGA